MVHPSNRQTALITGCSKGGIGDAIAQSLHRRGYHVFATARDLSKIQHLKELGMTVLPLDVVDDASLKEAVRSVSKTTGGSLDFLINNSGIGYSIPILDADLEYAKKMFNVNFFGRVATVQAFAPLLIKAKGRILNIGSIVGVAPSPWQSLYNSSMAAVNMWSDSLRMEMEPFGVKVILVVTGAVLTNFIDNMPHHLANDSLYTPAKTTIENAMSAKSAKSSFAHVDDFAEQVVKNLLRNTPKKRHWAGGMANLVWIVSTFFWATIWDVLLAKDSGLTEMKKKLNSK